MNGQSDLAQTELVRGVVLRTTDAPASRGAASVGFLKVGAALGLTAVIWISEDPLLA